MSVPDALRLAHAALDAAGIAHALIGALAMAALGVPRATADVDLLVDGDRRDEAKKALLGAGFTLFFESEDVLQLAGPAPLDCLFARRALSKAMLAAARTATALGVRCVGPEDVIGLKIQAYVNDRKRERRDKADIEALARAHPRLDWANVKEYAELFGEWTAIETIRATL